MANKMILCKTCGSQIASSAKFCPNCGAKNKKKRPILIGILVFLVLIVFFGSSGDDEPQKVETTTPTSNAETTNTVQVEIAEDNNNNPALTFSVGETAELNGVLASFVGISHSDGSTFNTPTEGNEFVICEFEISNNSDEELNISSVLCFNAYCDDYTCSYSFNATMEMEGKNTLDGTVAPGKKLNGVIGYEVPTDWKKLEVVFTPDVWNGKEITFTATNP